MRLVDPDVRYHRSYLAALAEADDAGDDSLRLPSWPAEGRFPGVDFTAEGLRHPDTFAELVRFLLRQRDPDEPRPRAYVAATELWMVEDGEYVGRIALRHELNELLHEWGGHIGYAVRPSARGKGHATAALLDMLELCAERGIDPVLVTCDIDNVASRRVIEKAGGQYEDTRQGKLRYWVPSS
ncbi:GNAT family N-acetyltransferase [Nocardioides caldifontis]|uniref:GNAT family N-acetyltransferase n=1 Tax=Nocardioides caldifontis TaxID=2588938 RepID=UPI0011DF17E4|nr:GNAT family N-acetyltransferase [Nocardioides caldifontis]